MTPGISAQYLAHGELGMQDSEMLGRTLGGFVVDQVGARKSWGLTCFAHNIRFEQQQVVVRLLQPEFARERPKQVDAFLERAANAVMSPHPMLADVFGAGKTDGFVHVISSRLKPPTLEEHLRESGPLDEGAAMRMVSHLIEGRRFAAEKGLVPVGFCPSEIVPIDSKHTKITSHAWPIWMLFEDVAHPGLESPFEAAYYFAPDSDRADVRADNYALGMLLHHTLTGKRPFSATTLEELQQLHREQDPPPVRSLRPEISQVTSDFISQMVSKRAIERPQTYENVLRWVEAALTRSRTNAAHGLASRYRQELDSDRRVPEANLESAPIPRAEFLSDPHRAPEPNPPTVQEGSGPTVNASAPAKRSTFLILVVDDNLGQIALMASILKRSGYQCVQATDGMSAFSVAKEKKPDLILLDVVMGDDDGYAACRRLKRDPETRDIPVVFVTSRSGESDRVWQTKLGATAFVPKPIDPDVLVKTVRRALAS